MIAKIAKLVKPAKGFLLVEIMDNEQPVSFSVSTGDKEEPAQRGRVIAVGEPAYVENIHNLVEPSAGVGDIVIHSSFGFEDIRIVGEELRLVPFNRVIAVINKDDYDQIQQA